MKTITILAFLLLLHESKGQIILEKKLQEYNVLINKAELFLVDNNITNASLCYKNAKKLKELYNCDLWNYTICLAILKNPNCFQNVKLLLQRGLSKNNILNAHELLYLRDSINNYNSFLLNYSSQTRKSIDSLFEEDQKYRRLDSCYLKFKFEIKKIDKSNVDFLIKLFDKNGGYLNESILGIGDAYLNEKLDIIILHQNFGNRIHDFSSNILIGINKGYIDLKRGLFLLSRSNGKDDYGLTAALLKIIYSDKNTLIATEKPKAHESTEFVIGFPKITKLEVNKINKKRILLGIGTLNEFFKKQLYFTNNRQNSFNFINSYNYDTYFFSSKSEYNNFKKYIIPLK